MKTERRKGKDEIGREKIRKQRVRHMEEQENKRRDRRDEIVSLSLYWFKRTESQIEAGRNRDLTWCRIGAARKDKVRRSKNVLILAGYHWGYDFFRTYLFIDFHNIFFRKIFHRKYHSPIEIPLSIQWSVVCICLHWLLLTSFHPS